MIPQLIMIGLAVLALGIELADHGKPKEGRKNVVTTAVGLAVQQGLLYWGGFYDELIRRVGG